MESSSTTEMALPGTRATTDSATDSKSGPEQPSSTVYRGRKCCKLTIKCSNQSPQKKAWMAFCVTILLGVSFATFAISAGTSANAIECGGCTHLSTEVNSGLAIVSFIGMCCFTKLTHLYALHARRVRDYNALAERV